METGGIPWAIGKTADEEPVVQCSTTCTYCWSVGRRPEQLGGAVKSKRFAPRYVPSIREDELASWNPARGVMVLRLICWNCGGTEKIAAGRGEVKTTWVPSDGGMRDHGALQQVTQAVVGPHAVGGTTIC